MAQQLKDSIPQALLALIPVVSALASDSRHVIPGALFFAFPGEAQDGRNYIAQAVGNGAAIIVYENSDGYFMDPQKFPSVVLIPLSHVREYVGYIAAQFYKNPSKKLNITGVTGTNGKTSVTNFIAQAWQQQQVDCAIIGTLGNGLLNNLSKSTHTTPDPIQLQQILSRFNEQGVKHVAIEVSSHALDQARVAGVNFKTAVYTQLSRDHLDYHINMQDYAAAKELLFQQPGLQQAVINADDSFGQQWIKKYADKLDIVTYSLTDKVFSKQQRFIIATRIVQQAHGFLVDVQSSWGDGQLICPLLGTFNISNVLATLGVLLLNNVNFSQALGYCANFQAVRGRMQMFGGVNQPQVIVDYAHTPDALEKTLTALRAHCAGKLWCVFGCGGDRDRGKRPQMAAIAENLADHIVITDDNPRHESSQSIAADIIAGLSAAQRAEVILNRSLAIQTAVQHAKINDIVLIAGKGHETTQIVGDVVINFDDAEQVALALQK